MNLTGDIKEYFFCAKKIGDANLEVFAYFHLNKRRKRDLNVAYEFVIDNLRYACVA